MSVCQGFKRQVFETAQPRWDDGNILRGTAPPWEQCLSHLRSLLNSADDVSEFATSAPRQFEPESRVTGARELGKLIPSADELEGWDGLSMATGGTLS